MAEDDVARTRTRITDPQVMRALAHPARIEIMEYLGSTGAGVTATQMASVVTLSPSATSYHLRELAKYGLVEQAPGRGDGRERVWRSTASGWNLDSDDDRPETRAAEQELIEVYLSRDFARLKAYFAEQHDNEPKEWRDASALMGKLLLLTAEELREVNTKVQELLSPYERRRRVAAPPEGARPVAVHYTTFPIEGLPS